MLFVAAFEPNLKPIISQPFCSRNLKMLIFVWKAASQLEEAGEWFCRVAWLFQKTMKALEVFFIALRRRNVSRDICIVTVSWQQVTLYKGLEDVNMIYKHLNVKLRNKTKNHAKPTCSRYLTRNVKTISDIPSTFAFHVLTWTTSQKLTFFCHHFAESCRWKNSPPFRWILS